MNRAVRVSVLVSKPTMAGTRVFLPWGIDDAEGRARAIAEPSPIFDAFGFLKLFRAEPTSRSCGPPCHGTVERTSARTSPRRSANVLQTP